MILLETITHDEIEQIHEATLGVLNEVGVLMTHTGARDMLGQAGAVLQDDRVRLPPELVENLIAKSTKRVTLRGRGEESVTIGDGNLHWHNVGGARDVYEPMEGSRRLATVEEVMNSTRVLDGLEQVSTITPFFTPVDVPPELMSLEMYRHTLPYTTKPVQGPGVQTAAEVRYIVRMAEVLGPPSEVLSLSVSPISPLTFPSDVVEAILEIARNEIPFGPLPCPIAGATAPMTLAGALVQQNAEELASIVLAELVTPGLPIVYCGRLSLLEPRKGVCVWGGAEMGIMSAATVQIGHRYGFPVNVYGLSTNAHSMNIQNGFERASNALLPALAGADELSGIGEHAAGVAGSYAQMVCDNEIAAYVRRIRDGVKVDQHALAVDVISTVMDGSRSFINQKHTALTLRSGEMLIPKLANRHTWEEWDRKGQVEMVRRSQAEAQRLLEQHEVMPLAEEQSRELVTIMQVAKKELVGQ